MADALPPLSLYLHFPWCVAKCPYCDFNSHSLRGELPAATYVDALLTELTRLPDELGERPLVSIFMGGGTPSLFPPAQLTRLLDAVRDRFQLAEGCEITLEANPGALEHAAFGGYLSAGINRLSLGVQSFSDTALTKLGRVHDSNDARAAFDEARAAGFSNINLDLMYALPGQTVAHALDDVCMALDLGPEHISHYHLTLEPNTVFHARPPGDLPGDDAAWDMQAACAGELRRAGFENYEVSAWGRPGLHSRHNMNYWRFGDYIGLGAGAHGKLSSFAGGELQVCREVRAAHPREYLRAVGEGTAGSVATVAPTDLVFEFMLNVLRLRDGVQLDHFTASTGLPEAMLEPGLSSARDKGLVESGDTARLRATQRGWRFLDDLQSLFLPSAGNLPG